MNFNYNGTTEKINQNGFDLDFTLLNAEKTLPSKGNFYYNKIIAIRGLRFREQMELSLSKPTDTLTFAEYIFRIYSNCIHIENLAFEDILQEDFYVLAIWIILLTNREQKWETQAHCQACNNTSTIPFNISTELDVEPIKATSFNELDTELGKLLIAPRTIRDTLEFEKLELPLKQEYTKSLYIKQRGGKNLSISERVDLYGMLNLKDIEKVNDIVADYQATIKPIIKECSCGATLQINPVIDITRGLP